MDKAYPCFSRATQLNRLRAATGIIGNGYGAASQPRCRWLKDHVDLAALANRNNCFAVVGLGKITARDDAGKLHGGAAGVGHEDAPGIAGGSNVLLAEFHV